MLSLVRNEGKVTQLHLFWGGKNVRSSRRVLKRVHGASGCGSPYHSKGCLDASPSEQGKVCFVNGPLILLLQERLLFYFPLAALKYLSFFLCSVILLM